MSDDLQLTGWKIAPVPPGLVDRIVAHVERHAGDELRSVGPTELPERERGPRPRPRTLMITALVAAAASLVVVVALEHSRTRTTRPPATTAPPPAPPPAPSKKVTPTLWPAPAPDRKPQTPVIRISPAEAEARWRKLRDAFMERWMAVWRENEHYNLGWRGPIWASRSDVEQVVGLAAPFLDDCLEVASAEARADGGEITVDIGVNSEPVLGTQIYSVQTVGGSLASDGPFASCVADTLRTLALPATPTGQDRPGGWGVRHTFEFVREASATRAHAAPVAPVLFEVPPTSDDLARRAHDELSRGDHARAFDFVEMALELDPTNERAFEAGAVVGCMYYAAHPEIKEGNTRLQYYIKKVHGGPALARIRSTCTLVGVRVP